MNRQDNNLSQNEIYIPIQLFPPDYILSSSILFNKKIIDLILEFI